MYCYYLIHSDTGSLFYRSNVSVMTGHERVCGCAGVTV